MVSPTPVTVRGPYRNGIRTRQQIIENASIAFARQGYSGATLREIADRVGITTGAVLAHFGDKEELLLAVLAKWMDDTQKLRREEAEGLDWFLGYPELIRYQMENPGLNELFLTISAEARDPQHPAHDWIADHYDALVDEAAKHLRLAIAAGEVAPMDDRRVSTEIRCLYATMDGLQLQWLSRRSFAVAEVFSDFFTETLRRWGAVKANFNLRCAAAERGVARD